MPKELDEMVDAIKRGDGAVNPYAVARAKLGTDAQIKARRKRKKRKGFAAKPGRKRGIR